MAHSLPPSSVGDLTTLGLDTTTNANANANTSVLVVGDGNFSYARAFLRKNRRSIERGCVILTATSLDTQSELLTMYPNACGVLDELHAGAVRVLHGINATKLESYKHLFSDADPNQSFDRIVFNFPHFAEGGSRRNKIHRHRELLRAFFASAVHVLHRDGQIWVALCAGQGGTALDTEQRSWGDTWQIVPHAAAAGLLLESVHASPVQELTALGYASVGYQLRERAFWTTDSLSHVFCRADSGRDAQLPILWRRDLSFWMREGFSEEKVLCVLRDYFPPETMEVAIIKVDDYHCSKTHRHAATYSVRVSSTRAALTKEDANARATAALLAIEASDFADSRDN